MKQINKSILLISAMLLCAVFMLAGCAQSGLNYAPDPHNKWYNITPGNEYSALTENPFLLTSENPVSHFSLDVNTASYTNIRKYINDSIQIVPNMVLIEEMINYFSYDYPEPQDGKPVSMTTSMYPCPWNDNAKLMTIGLKSEEVETQDVDNNLVFLIDVSGSMYSEDKIGYIKESFKMMVDGLNEHDTVSIVTYASGDKVVLDGTSGDNKQTLKNVIDNLTAGGSTAGSAGIETAYQIANKHFKPEGNNRVILATDGDFNVGIQDTDELENFIKTKSNEGIYLTVLGYGIGNLRFTVMETLANNGDGNFFYIDSLAESQRIFTEGLSGLLITVAKDVKAQVEFNPETVHSYRLLGYENKLLSQDEWDDDYADAGEINSGFTLTAAYEVILAEDAAMADGEVYATASVKYKLPDADTNLQSQTISEEIDINCYTEQLNDDQKFISAVIEAALIMRNSEYKNNANIDAVIERLQTVTNLSLDEKKSEFLELMLLYKEQIK